MQPLLGLSTAFLMFHTSYGEKGSHCDAAQMLGQSTILLLVTTATLLKAKQSGKPRYRYSGNIYIYYSSLNPLSNTVSVLRCGSAI